MKQRNAVPEYAIPERHLFERFPSASLALRSLFGYQCESKSFTGREESFKQRILESFKDIWGSFQNRTKLTPNLTTKSPDAQGQIYIHRERFLTLSY